MHRIWIQHPLAVLADSDASAGLVIEGNRIAEVLPAGVQPAFPCDSIFDAREHVITPGLVNCHHHFYQTLTRALPAALNQELFPWLQARIPYGPGSHPT